MLYDLDLNPKLVMILGWVIVGSLIFDLVCSIILDILIPGALTYGLLDTGLTELLNNSIIYYGNGLLKACDASSKTNMLPLPIDEPVSEKIIEATLLGHSKATRSHGFFKTDKDANVQKNRTFWQKAAGFFGGEVIEKGQEKPDFNNINTGTQWSQITSS